MKDEKGPALEIRSSEYRHIWCRDCGFMYMVMSASWEGTPSERPEFVWPSHVECPNCHTRYPVIETLQPPRPAS